MGIRSIIGVLVCFLTIIVRGQNPSYQHLGESELSGIDIYSILQDQNKNIWLTSNRGVIKYDGYDFKFLNADHLKALSSFGIKENSKGELFCFNLFGQILKIENDSILVHYELPDSLVFSRYDFEIKDDDALLLRSKRYIEIDEDKQLTTYEPKVPEKAFNSVFNAHMQCYNIIEKEPTNTYYTPNFYAVYKWDGQNFHEKRMNRSHIPVYSMSNLAYRTLQGNYYFTLRKGGMYAFDSLGTPIFNGAHLFRKYQISGFLEDYEGNMWLTTLGKGILLVQNDKNISFNEHPIIDRQNIIFVKYNSQGDVFLGSENGNILRVTKNNEISEVFSNGSVNIHFIDFYENKLITNGGMTVELVDLDRNISKSLVSIAAVKDCRKIGSNTYLVATSLGVYGFSIKSDQISDFISKKELGRCNAILPLNGLNKYMVSSVKGLYLVDGEKVEEINYQDQKFISSDLAKYQNQVFISTTTKGIYAYKNGEIVQHISTSQGLKSNRVQKIVCSDNLLFIATSDGMQIFDIEKNIFVYAYLSNALNGKRIIDFDVFNREIFVVTNQEIQKMNLDQLKKESGVPHISLTKIFMNDGLIDQASNNTFDHDQNKFEFHFKSGSYGHNGQLRYEYRLLPVEKEWEKADFFSNRTKYASLKPGEYIFQVKAINQYGEESALLEYPFIIEKPYWETWWFYLIISLFITTLILITWRIQLKRIQKKNEKEKEFIGSKLTALKLQMNPHFIFNALNSIQDLILKKDTENSYDYIVKFSNLVRRILNYSDQDFIEIEEEIEILQLYLELEDLRFINDFTFEIKNTIEEDIKIPSMLIQPFVENSVKHGLLHKEGEKTLKVRFQKDKETVICTIEDNGIGIKKSKEINARKSKKHKSISIESIRNRIEILKEYYKSDLGIEFVSLFDDEGNPRGTKVIIKLPFENTY